MMAASTTHLSSGLVLPCGVVLKNRIAKAALSEQMADADGAPGERLLRVWDRWSRSGAGLMLTGNVIVDGERLIETGNVVAEDERSMALMQIWAQTAKAGGSAVWVQINHPGRCQPKSMSHEPVAPSAIATDFGGLFAMPRALLHEEILDLIQRYTKAASICKAAGFDGVQIHAAHGYLISQFLSPLSNTRDDDWGGDAVRRRRFLIEIVRAVRATVGSSFPVGVKLNSADFQKGGFSNEESMAVVQILEAESVDLLEVSVGNAEDAGMLSEPGAHSSSRKAREAFFIEYAESVRRVSSIPLMLTGGFRSASGMQNALDSKAVDIVGMGRPFILEPDLPARILAGTADSAVMVPLCIGHKKVDALIQFSYYNAQLQRMGDGLPPDGNLNKYGAALSLLGQNIWWQTFGNPLETQRLERRKQPNTKLVVASTTRWMPIFSMCNAAPAVQGDFDIPEVEQIGSKREC